MKISIDGNYIAVKLEQGHLHFDCRNRMETIVKEMKRCMNVNEYFDNYDYQRIMIFILQNRRTIGVK